MISALRRTAEATTPRRRRRRRRANESTELSPHYMCNKRLLFTNVLRATETELPAFRHRQFIIISPAAHALLGSALLCSARCFLPLDFKRKTDRSEELKSVRPMKWCLSRFGFRLISVPAPPQKLRSRGAAEQFSLAIINDFIMIRPMDMFPLRGSRQTTL